MRQLLSSLLVLLTFMSGPAMKANADFQQSSFAAETTVARNPNVYEALATEPYWRGIARDKFGTDDETRLDLTQLTQLRITLAARSRSRSRHQAATV